MKIPVLEITDAPEGFDVPVVVGLPRLLVDEVPVEWPTINEWHVTFAEDGIATLTVEIPVRFRVVSYVQEAGL